MNATIEMTWSRELHMGIEWLETDLRAVLGKARDTDSRLTDWVEEFYMLNQVGSAVVGDWLMAIRDEDLPDDDLIVDNPHLLYYLYKMGLGDCDNFRQAYNQWVKGWQMTTGYMMSNRLDHTGAMRVLLNVDPGTVAAQNAINYFLANYERFDDDALAVGIIALFEYDYFRYEAPR